MVEGDLAPLKDTKGFNELFQKLVGLFESDDQLSAPSIKVNFWIHLTNCLSTPSLTWHLPRMDAERQLQNMSGLLVIVLVAVVITYRQESDSSQAACLGIAFEPGSYTNG